MDYRIVCSKQKGCCYEKIAKEHAAFINKPYANELIVGETGPRLKDIVQKKSFSQDAKHYQEICLRNLHLDDWKFFLQALLKYKAPVYKINLHGCSFTDKGAETLAWMLDNRNSGFEIQHLNLCFPKGSTWWIPGLYKNTTIKSLELERIAFWHGLLHFLQNGEANQLQHVECRRMKEEEDQKPKIIISNGLFYRNNRCDNKNDDDNDENNKKPIQNLSTFKISNVGETSILFSPRLSRTLGNFLRRCTRLQELHLVDFKKTEYDFVRDAIHCKHLTLRGTEFDTATIATLVVKNGGNLKSLDLARGFHVVRPQSLFQNDDNMDFANFHRFGLETYARDEALASLCHHLGSNRGPRHLCITFRKLYEFQDETVHTMYNKAIETLIASLKHNDKIRTLELHDCDCQSKKYPLFDAPIKVYDLFLQLIYTMPALTSFTWRGNVFYKDKSKAKTANEEIKKLVLDCIAKSKTIRHVSIPSFNNSKKDCGLDHMLQEISFRQLIKYQNNLSDGVWAHALSHKKIEHGRGCISNVKRRLSVMYSVIRQVPWLFRQAGGDGNDDDAATTKIKK